jgi:putative component of toxin-antitoxin plasmid stabilization module
MSIQLEPRETAPQVLRMCSHKATLDRCLKSNNLGDVRSEGDRVSEMREHFVTGWRMYLYSAGKRLL